MPKTRVKRSAIWLHFSIEHQEDGSTMTVRCNRCSLAVPYCKNTTNLWSHVRIHHKSVLESASSPPNRAHAVCAKVSPTTGIASNSSEQVQKYRAPSALEALALDTPQRVFPDLKGTGEITRSLVQMIAEDALPLSLIDGKGFVNFVKTLNENYELPTRDTLVSRYLPELYSLRCSELKRNLSKARIVHLTFGLWTNANRAPFFATTVHFCIEKVQHHKLLQVSYLPIGYFSENLQESLVNVSETWKIVSKIETVVHDGILGPMASTRWRQVTCFSHALNCSTRRAVESSGTILDVTNKCRKMVRVFELDTTATELLRRHQAFRSSSRILNLLKDTPDRWISTYLMLNRINNLRAILMEVFAETSKVSVPCLTLAEWQVILGVVNVLRPLFEATKELRGDSYVTISKVIPVVHGVEAALTSLGDLSPDVALFRDRLLAELDKQFENIEVNPVYAIATFLDPRYKGVAFHSEECVRLAKNRLMKELCGLDKVDFHVQMTDRVEMNCEREETSSVWAEFDKRVQELGDEAGDPVDCPLRHELERYANSKVINRKIDPLTWWNTDGNMMFPKLAKLASEYLCTPAFSVSNSSLFSKIRETLFHRKMRLPLKYVNMLAVTNSK